MAKNEFLPFGIAEGANVLSNQEYERLAARFNGFISGVAKSKELNTVWRQSSVMSSALAQFIVDSDNKDLLDNGDVASVKNRLVAAIKQTISGVGYVTTAAMNLELNKKFDKANISGVKGNDNDKVPSLNLFTTEVGKLQPKGDYQPAGDYATNEALNNGLNTKLNTSSVVQSTGSSTTDVMSQKAVTDAIEGEAIAGTIMMTAGNKQPSGRWLKANGSAISRTAYKELFEAIGETYGEGDGSSTFNIPDLRGYFPRFWDDGKGIDEGRAFGSLQEDAMQKIEGSFGNELIRVFNNVSGAFSGRAGNGKHFMQFTNTDTGVQYSAFNFDSSLIARTSTETRPKNIALVAWIKY